MMIDREAEFEAWRAALGSAAELDRCDAAEAPPEGADPNEVVAALIPLLSDPSDVVRICAAETLGQYPGTAAADALRARAAAEPDDLARAHALSSLGLVGAARDVEVLLRALGPNAAPHVAIHALSGLHELVRRLAKAGLAAYLSHAQPPVQLAAADALAQLVRERDDDDALAALREQLARQAYPGARADLRRLIEDVWGEGAADAAEQE